MRSFIIIGFIALIINVSGRETRGDRRLYKYKVFPLKDKRGTADYPSQSYSGGSSSYFTPINSPIGGHSHGSSASGYTLGHSSSSGLESLAGYGGHGLALGHSGGLNFAALSLGGHGSGQTAFTLQPLSYGSSPLISTASKTGPVTFGGSNQAYVAPIYATGVQGLSAYSSGGGHRMNIPIFSLGGHTSGYSLPAANSGYSSGHGLSLTSSGPHSYNYPATVSSSGYSDGHRMSLASSGSHSYNIPSSTGSTHSVSGGLLIAPSQSHGSTSSYSSASPPATNSNHDSTSSYHAGLSSGSPDNSHYQLPTSSSSYSTDSGSYSGYQPTSSEGHSYSNTVNSGYSLPSSGYSTSSTSYSSPSVSYSTPSSSYSNGHSSSYSNNGSPASTSSYSHPSVSYSAPSSSYSSSTGYITHPQPSNVYTSSAEQHGTHSHSSPSYLSYAVAQPKYDTISYSSSSEKY